MPGPARDTFRQEYHYVFRTIRFDTANAAAGIEFPFALPEGAVHVASHSNVVTAFNAGTTNPVTVGTKSNPTAFMSSAQADAGVAGMKASALGTGRIASDTTPVVYYTPTGTAPSAGEIDVWLAYLPRRS